MRGSPVWQPFCYRCSLVMHINIFNSRIYFAALVQDKGRAFGIYAIAVTRLSDNELWHIYRRYSDFHELHSSIKDKVSLKNFFAKLCNQSA